MKRNTLMILIALIVILPLGFKYYNSMMEKEAIQNSYIEAYIDTPASAVTHKYGLKFIILEEGNNQPDNDANTIVRSRSNVWVDGSNQEQGNSDGLDATDPIDIEVSHPFLSEILKASSTGTHYLWWVDSSLIPEGTSGFDTKNTMIDIKIVDRVAPMPAPDDVASIPDYATITESGVAYYLLSEPTTGANPTLDDMVEVHYSGWQTDGTMFDSSVLRNEPNTFPLGRLIEGWQKAVPLMHVGERARIWIPGDLAYDLRENRPHAPKGMLVFDVELISIPPQEEEKDSEE